MSFLREGLVLLGRRRMLAGGSLCFGSSGSGSGSGAKGWGWGCSRGLGGLGAVCFRWGMLLAWRVGFK